MAAAEYTIELRGPFDLELFDPKVAHDEIDEDPPAIEVEKDAAFTRGLELGRAETAGHTNDPEAAG